MKSLPRSAAPRDQFALPATYYARNSAFGYAHVLFDLVLLGALLWLLAPSTWPVRVVIAIGLGLAAYRLTFVVHDCSHRTLFARRGENEVAGRVAAALLGVSFPVYRRLHWVHHTHYGESADPQGVDYRGLVPGRDRVLRHLAAPLLLLNLVDKLGHFFALQHCGMTHEEAKATTPGHLSRAERVEFIATVLVAQAAIFAVASRGGRDPLAYLWYVAALPTVGLFVSRVRSYLEHGTLDASHAHERIARTHRSNFVERNVLSSLFFNYHNEHHRWPQVPSRWLPQLHRDVTADRLPAHEYAPSYLSSLARLVRAAHRRP